MAYFTIIIPLYNKENYIGKAIGSILAQTFQDFEIVVVDDCSTDGSVSKAREISSDKIRFIRHDKNKGLSASRNTGIRHATSDYVAFLDADDFWKPTFLEKIKALIDRFPEASLFATSYIEVFPGDKLVLPSVNKSDLDASEMILIHDFFVKNNRQPVYNHSSLCVKTTFFDTVGFYDETINFSEDVDFNIRANYGSPLAYYNGIESFYLIFSENQITNSGVEGKTIPDLTKYKEWEEQNPDLKKYVDFERYVLAKHCRIAGRTAEYESFVNDIDFKNLTFTQRILVRLPKGTLLLIRKLKVFFLLKGWRITSY